MIDLQEMERFERYVRSRYVARTASQILCAARGFLMGRDATVDEFLAYRKIVSAKTGWCVNVYFMWKGIAVPPAPRTAPKTYRPKYDHEEALDKLRALGRPFTKAEAQKIVGVSYNGVSTLIREAQLFGYAVSRRHPKNFGILSGLRYYYSFRELSEDEIVIEPQLFGEEKDRYLEVFEKREAQRVIASNPVFEGGKWKD